MPPIRDQAVCIRHWDWSETSQTVSLFSREHGLIRGIAKGAKREKGPFSGGIDLLTRGEVMAIVKPHNPLSTVTAWQLMEIFPGPTRSLGAHYAALYMADLIQHLFEDADPHPPLYDALIEALRSLADPTQVGAAALRFQWTLLTEAGYRPVLDRDARTSEPLPEAEATLAFSPSAGGVVTDTGGSDRWRVRAATVHLLRRLAQANGDFAAAVTGQASAVARANRLLAFYIRYLLDREPNTMPYFIGSLQAPGGQSAGE